jgi:hypothetical protein
MNYHSNEFSSVISYQECKLRSALRRCKQCFALACRMSSVSTYIIYVDM